MIARRTGSVFAGWRFPVRCQSSATGLDLGFYAAGWYSLMRPPRTRRHLIRSWERPAGGFVGPGRAELAVRWGRPLERWHAREDRPQVAFTEDQHPVGSFGPAASRNCSA